MPSFNRKAIIFFATGGLIGFSPVAPGTFGSLVALPLCLWMNAWSPLGACLFLAVFILAAVWIADQAESLLEENDPKIVVIDEICGMCVALIGIPFDPWSATGGFILFRAFDIYKPFPIRWIDKQVSGGWGIVMDDIIAGAFTNGILRLGVLYFGMG